VVGRHTCKLKLRTKDACTPPRALGPSAPSPPPPPRTHAPAGHCAGTTVPMTQKVPTGQAAVQALVSMLALPPKRPAGQGVGMANPASQ
jgi:hypothetical protein